VCNNIEYKWIKADIIDQCFINEIQSKPDSVWSWTIDSQKYIRNSLNLFLSYFYFQKTNLTNLSYAWLPLQQHHKIGGGNHCYIVPLEHLHHITPNNPSIATWWWWVVMRLEKPVDISREDQRKSTAPVDWAAAAKSAAPCRMGDSWFCHSPALEALHVVTLGALPPIDVSEQAWKASLPGCSLRRVH
jgi:hypothetical protein